MASLSSNADADLAAMGALIGDPARARMLLALLDGSARPASELAMLGGVSRPTASLHLAKLVEGGLLEVERRGRHRYFRLAGPEVGRALEALAAISPPLPARSLRAAQQGEALRLARMCYDHLAGRLGVALTERLLELGWLVESAGAFDLTARGHQRLARWGIDVDGLRRQRRRFAFPCLDWSERKHHLAGALGAALASRLLDLDWIRRVPRTRAVRLTGAGHRGLAEVFGLELEFEQ